MGGPHDVSLVELALEVVDDVGAGGEVGRHEDVGPVPGPPRIVLVVVRRSGDPLQPLRISAGPAPAGARVRLAHRRRTPGSSRLPSTGSWVRVAVRLPFRFRGENRRDRDRGTTEEFSAGGEIFVSPCFAVAGWGLRYGSLLVVGKF